MRVETETEKYPKVQDVSANLAARESVRKLFQRPLEFGEEGIHNLEAAGAHFQTDGLGITWITCWMVLPRVLFAAFCHYCQDSRQLRFCSPEQRQAYWVGAISQPWFASHPGRDFALEKHHT